MGIYINEAPESHILDRKDVIWPWRIDCQYRYTGAYGASDDSRRDQKRQRKKLTVANWIFAQTTHIVESKSNFAWKIIFDDIFLCFKIHQNRLSGFRDVGVGSKFALSHCFGHRLIQQLVLRTTGTYKPWCANVGISKGCRTLRFPVVKILVYCASLRNITMTVDSTAYSPICASIDSVSDNRLYRQVRSSCIKVTSCEITLYTHNRFVAE